MAAPIIRGTKQPQQIGSRILSSPANGTVTVEEWVAGQSDLDGYTKAAILAGKKVEYTKTTGFARAAVTSAGFGGETRDIVPIVSWQLITTQTNKDIKESPRVLALDKEGLQRVLQLAKDFKDGIPLPPNINFSLNDDYTVLFSLIIHGVTSYAINSHVIRRTVNVPIDGVGVAGGLAMPGPLSDAVSSIPVNGPNDGARFKWGWRKTGSQFVVAANNRVEISVEWALASWALLLYAGADISSPYPA